VIGFVCIFTLSIISATTRWISYVVVVVVLFVLPYRFVRGQLLKAIVSVFLLLNQSPIVF
jgi:hypothetical protein